LKGQIGQSRENRYRQSAIGGISATIEKVADLRNTYSERAIWPVK